MDINNFVKLDADGKLVIDNEAFTKAFTSELDKARTQASTTARANAKKDLETELRKQIEAEAKLTAEEKAMKDLEAVKTEIENERLELNKERVKNILHSSGMPEKDIEMRLKYVNKDTKLAIEEANEMATVFKEFVTAKEAEFQTKYQGDQPNPNAGSGGVSKDNSRAAKAAKRFGASREMEIVTFD